MVSFQLKTAVVLLPLVFLFGFPKFSFGCFDILGHPKSKQIRLKVRRPASSISQELSTEQCEPNKKTESSLNSLGPEALNKTKFENSDVIEAKYTRRITERKIGEVVQKVSIWRKLYNGYYDNLGSFIKMTLQDAANSVGISKKSLDDYLMQIRFGRRFGFNFNEHAFDNFGSLRTFVKKKKLQEKERVLMGDVQMSKSDSEEENKEAEADYQKAPRVKR